MSLPRCFDFETSLHAEFLTELHRKKKDAGTKKGNFRTALNCRKINKNGKAYSSFEYANDPDAFFAILCT
jgi:hypothetical protein